jgi:hypothetical protein
MRQLEEYVSEVRNLCKPVRAIVSSIECDDYSAWWEVKAYLAEPAGDDCVEPRRHGYDFERYLIELPPDEIDVAKRERSSSYIIKPATPKRPPDLEGADRRAAVGLGRAIASSLGVPFFVDPIEDRLYLDWWAQVQVAKLAELASSSHHVLVVNGRRGIAHDAQHGNRLQSTSEHLALTLLARRGALAGIVDESTRDFLAHVAPLAEWVVKDCSAACVRTADTIQACLRLADLIVVIGSSLTREPTQSLVFDQVQARHVPLVFIDHSGHVPTTHDAYATSIIEASPDAALAVLARALA